LGSLCLQVLLSERLRGLVDVRFVGFRVPPSSTQDFLVDRVWLEVERAPMKRSGSDGYGAPQLKRINSTSTDNGDDVEDQAHFHLRSQNRALSLEVRKSKMTIESARKELDMMRNKSREMEALVGTIQRAWSQLDIDTSLLLDSLGDTDVRFFVSAFCNCILIFVVLTPAFCKSVCMHAIPFYLRRMFVIHFSTPPSASLSVCPSACSLHHHHLTLTQRFSLAISMQILN
jgi:hypothetical protein